MTHVPFARPQVPVHVPAYDWMFLRIGGLGLIALGAWLARAPARSANDASTRGTPFASRAR